MATQQYGALIRSFRKNRHKRLSDVAIAAGVDISYLSRIERGDRHVPSIQLQIAIANALMLTQDEKEQLNQANQSDDLNCGSIFPNNLARGQVVVMLMNVKDAMRFLGTDILNQTILISTHKKENSM